MTNRVANAHFNWPIAAGVLSVHLVTVALLNSRASDFPHDLPKQEDTVAVSTTLIIDEGATRDRIPIPEIAIHLPNLNSIARIQFESAEWGDISAVVAPASAPQLARFQPVEPASFARRAGLVAGRAASVVLIVEVLPDGRAGSVEVSRGCGDSTVDAAAIAYAQLLRWIPGTRDHQAKAMRVNLPVTLIWSA